MQTQQLVYNNIINKSSALFITYGIRSITMDDICIQCGISKKTLYTFFENKDELVNKVIQEELEDFSNGLKVIRETGKNAIDEMMQLMNLVHKRTRRTQANLTNELAKYYPKTHQQVEAFRKDELLHFLTSNLERGISEGFFMDGFNHEIIAGMRLKQLESILSKTAAIGCDNDIEEISRQLNCHYISGLSTPEGFQLLKEYTHPTQA